MLFISEASNDVALNPYSLRGIAQVYWVIITILVVDTHFNVHLQGNCLWKKMRAAKYWSLYLQNLLISNAMYSYSFTRNLL